MLENNNNEKKYCRHEAHIVYASDNKFAEILGVSLLSLFENSRDMKIIHVYILDSGIDETNKKRIEWICGKYKRNKPLWIKARDIIKELKIDVSVDRGSLAQYARLFISRDLPENISRVLYLDCDTLITKSIYELWNLDLHGKTIAALEDAFSPLYRKNINLKKKDLMFNSGVMLIDLDRWKQFHIEKKLLNIILEKDGMIQQGDQGALNAVLSDDVYCFIPKFNSVTIFFDFTYEEMLIYRKPHNFYSKDVVLDAVTDPSIIHFTTSFLSRRPWVEGCNHKYCDLWLSYKEKSPWKNKELCKYNKSIWVKLGIVMFHIFPRKFSIFLAGILQAYGRPIFNGFILKLKSMEK